MPSNVTVSDLNSQTKIAKFIPFSLPLMTNNNIMCFNGTVAVRLVSTVSGKYH